MTKAAKNELEESSCELENWKNTATAQLRSLKIEFFEDTQPGDRTLRRQLSKRLSTAWKSIW